MATLDRMNKERIDRRISEESTPSHHNSTSFDRYNMVTLHGEISTHKDSLACNTNEESAAAGGSVASSDRRSMTLRSQSLNCLGNDTSAHAKDACGSRNSTGEVAATMNYLYTVKTLQRHRNMERKASARNLILPSSHSLLTGHHNKRTELPPPQQQPSSPSEQTPLMITSNRDDERGETPEASASPPQSTTITATSQNEALWRIVCGKGVLSWTLLVMPVSLWAVHRQWSATWIFWLNFTVIIPLASILGDFTEEVALHTNEVTGGLINASFGNAVEVVVAIQALLANEIRVVQASMLGSIFSNLLLVLGSCFFFGGLYYKEQTFNNTAATANISLLALSSIALVLPTPFAEYYDLHDDHVLIVSRIAAIVLIFMYAQLLLFQLHTHADIFKKCDDGDDEMLATVSLWTACLGLLVVTLLVTIFSNYLVNSIAGFTKASGVSRTFVGLIIIPIVGNAVEHISAVSVAMKNKMDLSMGIAVGSCTQISLFVVPLTVLFGWVFDKDMTLNFPHFEVILYVLSVFTVSVVCSNPICNWLEGSLLMTTYCLIAVGFWYENVRDF